MDLKKKVRNIPNFPKEGITFRDIGPLLEDKTTFGFIIDQFVHEYRHLRIDKVVGIDARGFILAGVLADRLKAGFVMVRKKGKLPSKVHSVGYSLEYGRAVLEMHQDSIKAGERVLIVDDVLATGGTVGATASLVKKAAGKIVGIAFLIVLDYLAGRKKLKDYPLFFLINYPETK
ncbi:adenine phosphoribosyltransferase [Patescibacteria group bacterium]